MNDEMAGPRTEPRSFAELERRLEGRPPCRVALAPADDAAGLEALREAGRRNLARPILIGDRDRIEALLDGRDGWWTREDLHHEPEPEAAVSAAFSMVVSGEADLVMKGRIRTADLLRTALARDVGFKTDRLLSHVLVAEPPGYGRLLFVADTGIVLRPDLKLKAGILHNTIDFSRSLGVGRPAAAILSATETVMQGPGWESSRDAAALEQMAADGRFGDVTVRGPVDVSIAVDPASADVKGVDGAISGVADIWLVPDAVGGNILCKSWQYLFGARTGGLAVGGRSPIVLLSRSSSLENKLTSLLLGVASCAADITTQQLPAPGDRR